MKKLLIITTNFPPSISIGTQRILRICKYLDPQNWTISLLTLKENYYPDLKERSDNDKGDIIAKVKVHRTKKLDIVYYLINFRESLRKKKKHIPGKKAASSDLPLEKAKGINKVKSYSEKLKTKKSWWTRTKDFFTDIMQFPDKNITWLPIAIIKGYRIVKKEKVDVIFSSSPPHSLHLISTIIKLLTKKRLVVDFRDPWARSPWHVERRNLNRYAKWKARRIIIFEKWIVKNADKVLLITKEMRDDYAKHYSHFPQEKFVWFSNGYDPDYSKTSLAKQNGKTPKPAKVRFIHAGSLYRYRDPTPILKSLKNLIESNLIDPEKIEFLFVGGLTDDQAHMPQVTTDMGLNDIVKYIPPVSYNRVMEYMENSQILILLQPGTKLQLPGKFFDYLSLGKPILALADKDSATQNIIKEDFGVFAEYGNLEAVQNAILFLYQNPAYNLDVILKKREEFNISKSIVKFQNVLEY